MSLRNVTVSHEELVEELGKRVAGTTQAALARKLKMAAPLISNMVQGKANICGKVLKWLGYERVVVYRKLDA